MAGKMQGIYFFIFGSCEPLIEMIVYLNWKNFLEQINWKIYFKEIGRSYMPKSYFALIYMRLYITLKNIFFFFFFFFFWLILHHVTKNVMHISPISEEREKISYKKWMDISLALRDIVGILPISPMPTLFVWLPWRP